MALKITQAGFRSLIQDKGRYGYHNIGLGVSGAIDEVSYLVGQYLLGNASKKNAIEILLGNFVAEVQKDTNFSITGADSIVFKNEQQIPMWSRFFAKTGDIIKIEKVQQGVINYLAVEGGFTIKPFFGSYATNFKLGLGANQGHRLAKQTLPYQSTSAKNMRFFQKKFLPIYWQKPAKSLLAIDLVLFPNVHDYFTKASIQQFFQNIYKIGLQSDRVGIRLESKPLKVKKELLFSEGLSYGTVQIQNSGLPILLMKDCQTIGGYPKMGYVNALDCSALAQTRAKEQIRFCEISAKDSQKKTKSFYKNFPHLL